MKCFVSYNKNDKKFVQRLGKDLIDNNIDVWWDGWEIYPGESIVGRIEEGLKECRNFIIVMTPNSMKSEWVKKELRTALYSKLSDDSKYIIPIMLEKCDINELIKDIKYIDFRNDYEEPFNQLLKTITRLPIKPSKYDIDNISKYWIADFYTIADYYNLSDTYELPEDIPKDDSSLCKWLENDLKEKLSKILKNYKLFGSFVDVQTLYIRVAFELEPERNPLLFGDMIWWQLEKVAPYEEVYFGDDGEELFSSEVK